MDYTAVVGQVKVKLKEYLEDAGVSAYRLAQSVRGLSPKTVYAVVAGQRNLSVDSLGSIIGALREITSREVSPADLLEYVETEGALSASGLPYTGDAETDAILDDPEVVARILSREQAQTGLSLAERRLQRQHARENGELIPWREIRAQNRHPEGT